jgi:hypothetical protein
VRRVLSLWQPWATLCVVKDPLRHEVAKKIETRAFPPDKFGVEPPFEVVIHATKSFGWEQRRICEDQDFLRALNARGYYAGSPKKNRHDSECPSLDGFYPKNCECSASRLKPLPLGMIIGTAMVRECIPADALLSSITVEEKKFGLYLADRWAWILDETQELPKPIPFKGRQYVLWRLDSETNAEVTRRLGLTLATSDTAAQNSSR